MKNIQIKINKACSGLIRTKDGIIFTRDNYASFEESEKILKNINIEYIDTNNRLHYGYIEDAKSYIKYIEGKSRSKDTQGFTYRSRPDIYFICPVTEKNYNKIRKYDYPQFFKNIKSEISRKNKLIPEIQYLDSIDGHKLYHIDDDIVILPDFIKYPISKKDIDHLNSKETVYDALYNMHFTVFIVKQEKRELKYKSLYDFQTEQDIEFLNNIKEKINRFYENILGKTPNSMLVSIYARTESKWNFVTFSFNLFDNYKADRYTFIGTYYTSIRLEDLITMVKNKNLVTHQRFYGKDKDTKLFCKDNSLYQTFDENRNQILNQKEKKYTIIQEVNFDQLKIIKQKGLFNNFEVKKLYHVSDKTKRPRCTNNIIIYSDGKYYNIAIRSITYYILGNLYKKDQEELMFYTFQKFGDLFMSRLKKILEKEPNIKNYDRTERRSYNEYIDSLPNYYEIEISEPTSQIPIGIYKTYILETVEDYRKKILPHIKNATVDNALVITLIYNSLDQYRKNEVKKKLDMHQFFSSVRYSILNRSKNFIIRNSIENKEGVYVLWYFPKIEFKQNGYQIFLKMLDELNNEANISKNMKSYQLYVMMRESEKYKEILHQATNFYDLYKNEKFVHNIRHLSPQHKEEINIMLTQFIKTKYRENIFDKNLKNRYYSIAHYPNLSRYNVFHMKIISFSEGGTERVREDLLEIFRSNRNRRAFLWDDIYSIDYQNINIVTEYSAKLKNLQPNEEDKKNLKKSISLSLRDKLKVVNF